MTGNLKRGLRLRSERTGTGTAVVHLTRTQRRGRGAGGGITKDNIDRTCWCRSRIGRGGAGSEQVEYFTVMVNCSVSSGLTPK